MEGPGPAGMIVQTGAPLELSDEVETAPVVRAWLFCTGQCAHATWEKRRHLGPGAWRVCRWRNLYERCDPPFGGRSHGARGGDAIDVNPYGDYDKVLKT